MKKKILLAVIVVVIFLSAIAVLLTINRRGASSPSKESVGSLSSLLAEAKGLEAKGDLMAAQSDYKKLISDFSGSDQIMQWQKKVEELNIKLLFSPVITPKSQVYEIRPGDNLGKIARKFNTTVELITKSNNLNNNNILAGKKIKVQDAPFSILVDKSQSILLLKSDEEIVKTYIVSTGANNSTPLGTFKIVNKLQNPTWFKAGAVVAANSPENILGTRWLGFDLAGYGIHGTTQPESLGKQVTQGCVRMANSDAEELYTIVPVGTEVVIVD